MPKSVKPTPPQQSSLAEMWGKVKQGSVVPKSEESGMDVGSDEHIHGMLVAILFCKSHSH
jgi:hypothetical protein